LERTLNQPNKYVQVQNSYRNQMHLFERETERKSHK
jgi:hypothetical protein